MLNRRSRNSQTYAALLRATIHASRIASILKIKNSLPYLSLNVLALLTQW
jgi:hypothetical protein